MLYVGSNVKISSGSLHSYDLFPRLQMADNSEQAKGIITGVCKLDKSVTESPQRGILLIVVVCIWPMR